VYVNYRPWSAFQVQAGKFKLPFSLDENTSATSLNLVRRSMAADQLAPGRDRGVMLHGRLFERVLRYEIGIFERDGEHARTDNPERVSGGRTTAARLRLSPFGSSTSWMGPFHGGFAMTASEVPEGHPGLLGRTVLDASFFQGQYWVKGRRTRYGAELRWQPGPFSLESEYLRVVTERRGMSVEDSDLSPLLAAGWYVSGTWAVTGERKARGLERPHRPLFQGGFGAIELAARIESLVFRSAARGEVPSASPRAEVILGGSDRAETYGVNWHPNRWIKVQGNLVRERVSRAASEPLPAFWSRLLRVQFTL
jgi:phosphate-selective porin